MVVAGVVDAMQPTAAMGRPEGLHIPHLREWIDTLGLTYKQIGERIGVEGNQISRYLSGARGFPRHRLEAFASLCGVTVNDIKYGRPGQQVRTAPDVAERSVDNSTMGGELSPLRIDSKGGEPVASEPQANGGPADIMEHLIARARDEHASILEKENSLIQLAKEMREQNRILIELLQAYMEEQKNHRYVHSDNNVLLRRILEALGQTYTKKSA